MSTPADPELTTELMVAIARRLETILAPGSRLEDGCPEGFLDTFHTSIFEMGCGLLWDMGLAVAATADRTDVKSGEVARFPRFVRPDTEAEIWTKLAGGLPGKTPAWETLFETFIGLACDFADAMPTHRDPFDPPNWAHGSVKVLVRHGYLTQSAGRVAWTDKSAPTMIARHFWQSEEAR